ncbi:hypothetical protein C4097_06465 [Clostridioides difficile]|uniref:hypothetical protein n=1 Tax=Clostridioides sp. ZZV15-6598 TaxID=2811501 RepID=UPI001D122D7E|nr:hypothetical protein [Clostridioides sp. ZZV15-6598]MDB3084203.1 hypothetical protein [Clostridioides difficile]
MTNKLLFEDLKPNARISKSKLKEVISIFKNKIDKVEINDGYYELEKENGLIKNDSIQIISVTKSLIKQYLVYHFLPYNKCFVRKHVSYKDIAILCGISIPTARKNQDLLSILGLAYFTPSSNGYGKFDIVISDEYKNHFKKKYGGGGYITLTLDDLVNFLDINCINELKVELKKLLWVDAAKKSKGKKIVFNKANLVNNLPEYIKKSSKLINNIIYSKNSKFKPLGNRLDITNYKSKSEFNKNFRDSARKKILNLLDNGKFSLSSNYSDTLLNSKSKKPSLETNIKLEAEKALIINDLVNLSIEFGFKKVLIALNHMFDSTYYEDNININNIHNPAGFIRNFITKSILNFGSLY